MESITKRIKEMQTQVNELKAKEEEKKKKDEAAAAAVQSHEKKQQARRLSDEQEASGPGEQGEEALLRLWRQLRLDVNMQVEDVGDAYVVQVRRVNRGLRSGR